MPEYHARVEVELMLTARNQDEAEERAGSLLVEVKLPADARWGFSVETIEVIGVLKEDE